MLLNRYVDLTEAIDEGNASLLDNSDFAEATNVPLVDDRTLPTKQVCKTEISSKMNVLLAFRGLPTPSPLVAHNAQQCTRLLCSPAPFDQNARNTRESESYGWTCQHIPLESEREEVRDWVLSVCMDAKIDQALPPEKEAGGTLYQVRPNVQLGAVFGSPPSASPQANSGSS